MTWTSTVGCRNNMATEGSDLLVRPAVTGSEDFRKFVKRLVNKETSGVLESLAAEGSVIGKRQISLTINK